MKSKQLAVALFALAVVTSACGSKKEEATTTTKATTTTTEAVPTTIVRPDKSWPKPELPNEPANASITQKVEYAILKEVITAAGKDSNTAVDCKGADIAKAGTYQCSVKYGDLTFDVPVESEGGSFLISYNIKATQLPLTKEKAEHQLLYDRGYNAVSGTCEMSEVQLVNVDQEGAFRCTVKAIDYTNKVEEKNYRGKISSSGYLTFAD